MKRTELSFFRHSLGIALALAISGSMGCSTWDKLNQTEKGAVIGVGSGAVIGGAAGNTGGALLGGAAGGLAGGVIGNQLDKRDDRDDRYDPPARGRYDWDRRDDRYQDRRDGGYRY